jgi:hypothetical protein
MKNYVHYVPAGFENFIHKGKVGYNLRDIPLSYYLYNAVTYLGKGKIEEAVQVKEAVNAAGRLLMCDSGGFQLATGVVKSIDPVGIIDVQNRIADIGFILDVPTMRKTSEGHGMLGLTNDASEEYLDECLQKTIKHIRLGAKIEKSFKYYMVIQGSIYNHIAKWYDAIRNEDKFYGFATKATTYEQLMSGLFLSEQIVLPGHHILGLGATRKFLIVKYFYLRSKQEREVITCDNTNYIQNGKRVMLQFPFTDDFRWRCKDLAGMFDFVGIRQENMDNRLLTMIMNMYWDAYAGMMLNVMDTSEAVKEFVNKNFKSLSRYIIMIDEFFDNGLPFVLEKYKDELNREEQSGSATNIMSFFE